MTTDVYYLHIDCEAADAEACLSLGSRHESDNGTPFAVWHGRAKRFEVPYLKAAAQKRLLEEAQPIAEEIWSLVTTEWNGNNHVGVCSDEDAMEALEAQLEAVISSYDNEDDRVNEWEADAWFGGVGRWQAQAEALGITENTTDEELATICEREGATAASEGVELDGAAKHLEWIRSEARTEAEDAIDATSLGEKAARDGAEDFRSAAEAAIPQWVSRDRRRSLIEEFVDAAETLYLERAENPTASAI